MTSIAENILVPVVLIAGGLLFLLLALSRRIAFVEISAHLRRLSAILGAFLLLAGVGLFAFTTLLSSLSSLRQSESVVSSSLSVTPLPTTSPISVTEVESTIQAEVNVVASEVAQSRLVSSPNSAAIQTADFRATAGVRLTETQAAVDQTSTATSWTATPSITPTVTVTPSMTPLPTSTLFPTSAVLQENAQVLFRDEFSRDRLTFANWRSNGIEPILTNDRLIFEGVNRWGDSLERSGIMENEGILLLFQHTTGEMQMYLETGEYGEDDYRRWSFARFGNEWEAGSTSGDDYTVYESARLREATWHYLLMRIGSDGDFYTQVWEADDPSGFHVNLDLMPEGSGWETGPWRFVIQVHSGTLELEFYEDIWFPSEYQSLGSPPQLTPES
jgi:hypothetical protein